MVHQVEGVPGTVLLARVEHQVAYQELSDLLRKHAGTLDPIEVLAVASNMVGKLIAMQDRLRTTPEQAMQVVSRNIEAGNNEAFAESNKMRYQRDRLAAVPVAGRA